MDNQTLEQLVGEMDKKKLISLIGYILQTCSAAEQALLVYCQKEKTSANPDLVQSKLLLTRWKNALVIIDDANTYGGCSDQEEEDASCELEEISKLVQENDISWEYRIIVLDEMLVQIARDNSGFTDVLVDTAELLCRTTPEKEYFAENLAKNGNSYYKKYAASIYRELGDIEKSLIIRKANLEYDSDYLDLARYYDDQGDNKTALKIVMDGLDHCTGRLGGIYKYLFERYQENQNEKALWELYEKAIKNQRDIACIAELMYEHCKQKGDYQGRKSMLLRLLESCYENSVKKWYEQCQKDFIPDDWHREEATLLRVVKKKSITTYLDICLEKGNGKEVLEYIINAPGGYVLFPINAGHRYSKLLVQDYPNEILQFYWREVHSLISMSKDKYYVIAASTLKEIKAIMMNNKLAEEWEKQFNDLKDIHRRRKNFLKVIAGL